MASKESNYEIKKKRNGRFYIRTKGGKVINGDEKTKILVDAGIVKVNLPKPAPVEEAAAPGEEKGE